MRKMVLVDLDRTLINERYQLTDCDIADVIRAKKQEGWEIGLTSDTPMPTLFQWWEELGLNGPILLEKGAVAWFPEDDAEIVFTKAQKVAESSRHGIITTLSNMPNTMLVCGDATAFIRGVRFMPGVLDRVLVAFNGLRKYSIAFFVREIDSQSGEILINNALSRSVINQIRQHLPHTDLLTEGILDERYGFFYINPADVSKESSALKVFDGCNVFRRVVIGDSMADHIQSASVEVYAVGNADFEFKGVARRVAKANYTEGVIELLSAL